ncbi:hypothetical protein ACIHEI_36655 [Kitasatospora sp. NPDC051984]|uniref:hypothetical protein n=1 Tax=Kitasatospora sp. NPDC051984 TaxID=3364059 RepID=UPI0037C5CF21
MLTLTDHPDGGWLIHCASETDDPEGWLAKARGTGHLENMLAALGDPMRPTQVTASGTEAEAQLKAVSWFIEQLARRQDALLVALKDSGTSWSELARLVDPEESDPMSKRSAMQRKYETGRRRAGLR